MSTLRPSSDYPQKLAQEISRGIFNRPALASRTAYTNHPHA